MKALTQLAAVGLAALLGLGGMTGAYAMDRDSSNAKQEPPMDPDYVAAEASVKAGKYSDAVALLQKVVQRSPGDADAWNYLGYADRKLGKYPDSLAAYEKALAINPDHRGAIEYLGELYLQTGDVPKAKEQLARLDRLCFFGCPEYTALKTAINGGPTASSSNGGGSSGNKW